MPNIDKLMDGFNCSRNYSLLTSDTVLIFQSNFSFVSKGHHRTKFQTEYYGRFDMPATIQHALDRTLWRLQGTYVFLDNFLMVTKEKEIEHITLGQSKTISKSFSVNKPSVNF